MSYEAVARRYGRAIFEIGKETGTLANLSREIGDASAMYSASEELRLVLDNPLIPEVQRDEMLGELGARAGFSEVTRNTLLLLARRRRLAALPEIARQLAILVDQDQNIARAVVTSAGPLSDGYLDRLRAELERSTGRKISIIHRQDPSLIAGVVTQIGDQVIDGSLRTRLSTFRENLLRT
ncbi:F0F1 ATP synthase subunit delta [Sorangium cellulosum]|uniref:ATP synthase subunit delta n=1 Tax=Sorangium cellulosum TaxID=56 RepID=A0A150Q2S8_SORCE|nr:F0F1 ATP synthase subunit delta [Sorangium cellulosum]KYF62272.1 ATP synthase subunit delta [Sorangium cellulosum]